MAEHDQQGRAEKLETIFETIQNGQWTGTLNVERGKGGVRDLGKVVFLHGQAVEAVAGGRNGVEALEWLQTWGNCQYAFTEQSPAELVIAPPPTPQPVQEQTNVPVSLRGLINQLIPRTTQPLNGQAKVEESVRKEQYIQLNPAGNTPIPFHPSSPETPLPETRYTPDLRYSQPRIPGPSIPGHIPRRLVQGPEAIAFIERIGLSRLHRHVFFLLDGQRTTADIVRLTRHPFDEIQRLLNDLEQVGLITRD